jgi:hypothetical protein
VNAGLTRPHGCRLSDNVTLSAFRPRSPLIIDEACTADI